MAHDILIVSDFNARNLAGFLQNSASAPVPVHCRSAPYGQVSGLLLQPDHPSWSPEPDGVIVWTRPEATIPSFRRALAFETVEYDQVQADVDSFAEAIRRAAGLAKTILVPTWTVPEGTRGWGMLDLVPDLGFTHTLNRMNLRLADQLADVENIFLLNADRWLMKAGTAGFSPRLWYTAKVPFGPAVFREAAADIIAAMEGRAGRARKIVIVDLDNTLWGGVVGEVGWENLRLGGHDPIGEAHASFQHALKGLTRRGILLGLVSKNEEAVALEAMESHPEMVLRSSDFAAIRINWRDKAQNILELIQEVNLGLDSAVFIDDHPVERARVREALPSVMVPEWSDDAMEYVRALGDLRCFDVPFFTEADSRRAQSYAAERVRKESKKDFLDLDDWLRSLGTVVSVEPIDSANIVRVVQLLNKTNQMNLSTRRLTQPELEDWLDEPSNRMWAFRVSDRFGDTGLIGIASLKTGGPTASIVDFVLSCRVMGRRIEESIVAFLVREARRLGASTVQAEYLETKKNVPCLRFWEEDSAFERVDENVYSWNTSEGYEMPKQVEFQTRSPATA